MFNHEETQELRGVSDTTGVALYVLIAFNTMLDVMIGCTSGGARTEIKGEDRMVHFRTLD